MIVAWHEVPGKASSKGSVVGHGLIRAGVRAGIRSYRTLRDGSRGGRCPRHFVPGYDRGVPPGQRHSPIEGIALS
jgi:hypothetical protein